MAYADLLKDTRWQQKRLETLADAKWLCESCEERKEGVPLHVHHKVYRRGAKPWEYDREDLSVLCEPCHKTFTVAFRLLEAAVYAAKAEGDVCAAEYFAGLLEATVRPNGRIKVETHEQARGIGETCKATAEEILAAASESPDGCIVPVDILLSKG
jgi:hypothetical protein